MNHMFSNNIERDNKNLVEFAQCLIYVFEKGLNVQFMDWKEQLNNQQMQCFFFIGKNDLTVNRFSEDLKVADFWQKLDDRKKKDLLTHLVVLEQECNKQYNEVSQHFENIKEQVDDEAAEGSSNRSDEREYDDVLQLLRDRKKEQAKNLQIPS
jgi:hypothetical protein